MEDSNKGHKSCDDQDAVHSDDHGSNTDDGEMDLDTDIAVIDMAARDVNNLIWTGRSRNARLVYNPRTLEHRVVVRMQVPSHGLDLTQLTGRFVWDHDSNLYVITKRAATSADFQAAGVEHLPVEK